MAPCHLGVTPQTAGLISRQFALGQPEIHLHPGKLQEIA